MLRKLQEREFDALAEITYSLSQDLSKTSFPLYIDGIKSKSDFLEKNRLGLHQKNHEILVYERDGVVQGWIHYYSLPEDTCICISNMSIREGYADAFLEAMDYWKEKFPGYTWASYFPIDNRSMTMLAEKKGFMLCPKEYADILFFRDYHMQPVSVHVGEVTKETFPLFRELHKMRDNEIYWTSDRIEEDLDNWAIYAYIKEGRCMGALYYNGRGDQALEIFGMDFLPGYDTPEVSRSLLAACLNDAKEAGASSIYHWPDTEGDQEIALDIGFRCTAVAQCIKGAL